MQHWINLTKKHRGLQINKTFWKRQNNEDKK